MREALPTVSGAVVGLMVATVRMAQVVLMVVVAIVILLVVASAPVAIVVLADPASTVLLWSRRPSCGGHGLGMLGNDGPAGPNDPRGPREIDGLRVPFSPLQKIGHFGGMREKEILTKISRDVEAVIGKLT